MNHEFEWRRQMRKLGDPVEPGRDLWPGIAARVAGPAQRSRPRPVGVWLAIAASVIAAVGALGVALHWQRSERAEHPAVAASTVAPAAPAAAADLPPTALDWAVPSDPALAASAQKLDNASAQLQSALEQRPDAVFLVGLLNRTNAQRLRLMRKSPYSG